MKNISISIANKEDSFFFYYLRNEAICRHNSLNTSLISTEDHDSWFEIRISSSNHFLIVGSLDNEKIGVCRFEFQDSKTYIISYALIPSFRGLGLSHDFVDKAINKFLELVQTPVNIIANVRDKNISSIKLLKTLNFEECKSLSKHNHYLSYILKI